MTPDRLWLEIDAEGDVWLCREDHLGAGSRLIGSADDPATVGRLQRMAAELDQLMNGRLVGLLAAHVALRYGPRAGAE